MRKTIIALCASMLVGPAVADTTADEVASLMYIANTCEYKLSPRFAVMLGEMLSIVSEAELSASEPSAKLGIDSVIDARGFDAACQYMADEINSGFDTPMVWTRQ